MPEYESGIDWYRVATLLRLFLSRRPNKSLVVGGVDTVNDFPLRQEAFFACSL